MKGKSLLSEIPRFPKRSIKKTYKNNNNNNNNNKTKKHKFSYAKMVRETLSTISATSTSSSKAVSSQAIARYFSSHFGVEVVNQNHLNKVLQQGVDSGVLRKVKRSFLLNSKPTPTKPIVSAPKKKLTPTPSLTPTLLLTPTLSLCPTLPLAPLLPRPSTPPPCRPSSPATLSFTICGEEFKEKKLSFSFFLAGYSWKMLVYPNGFGTTRPYLSLFIAPGSDEERREVKMLKFTLVGKEGGKKKEMSKVTSVTFQPREERSGVCPPTWGFLMLKLDELEGWLWKGRLGVVVEMEMA